MALLTNPRFLGFLLAAMTAVLLHPVLTEASFLPLPDTSGVDVPTPEGDTAIEKTENLLGPLARVLRIIIAAVAVAYIVMSGALMVVQGQNEETAKEQKKAILYAVLGLGLISIAGPIAEIFDYRQGNFLEDADAFVERSGLIDNTTGMVITFMKYVLGSLAALSFIGAGAGMIAGSYSEEQLTRHKKNLALGAGGLFMVLLSELVVRKVLYDVEYNSSTSETVIAINQNEGIAQVVAITNLIVSFVGPIMMLGIVIAGVLYITANGDEERTGLAKKILLNSVIGVVIIYGAFALVSTVITGVF